MMLGMSQGTLSIVINALSVSIGMFLVSRYRLWKMDRREIPMEQQNGVWVADGKLKRWERRAKWGFWTGFAFLFVLGYLLVTNLDMSTLPPK